MEDFQNTVGTNSDLALSNHLCVPVSRLICSTTYFNIIIFFLATNHYSCCRISKLGTRVHNLLFFLSSYFLLPLFSTDVPSNIYVSLSCRPFVVNTKVSTGLVGVEVTSVSLGQLTVGV